jgi:hypothetical protein
MTSPGETEAGSAGLQPCPGIAQRAHRDDDRQRRNGLLALLPTHHRIEKPQCLENPRPKGRMLTNGERLLSSSGSPSHDCLPLSDVGVRPGVFC